MSKAKPNVSGILGALGVGEVEAEARHISRAKKVEAPQPSEGAAMPRPKKTPSARKQFTITLSPAAVEIVEAEILVRMQDKSLRPLDKSIGPTIEALILEAYEGRKGRQ